MVKRGDDQEPGRRGGSHTSCRTVRSRQAEPGRRLRIIAQQTRHPNAALAPVRTRPTLGRRLTDQMPDTL
jgi:hypothetical protein